MLLKKWEEMPEYMRNSKVKPYYEILRKKNASLLVKRAFDIIASLIGIVVLSPVMLVTAILIRMDSPGSVFFRQVRVTAYGRTFRILKFRSMVSNAESVGTQVTVQADSRVTRVGKVIRRYRIDEIPQLFNILAGDMTFVGVRPEVEKYVRHYTDEMYATLLLPAGVTSEASIRYKDEDTMLCATDDPDEVYVRHIMPGKMFYNLKAIRVFSLAEDVKTLFRTVLAVCGKEYADVREDMKNGTYSKP